MVEVSLNGPDFAALMARLKNADKAVLRELRKAIRRAGAESAMAVRREIGNIPSSGKYPTDVRGGLARGTRVSIRAARAKSAGVLIVTSPSALPPGKRSLAKAMNKESFRHPSYGNRNVWVSQKGHPYFGKTITNRYPVMQGQILHAMAEAERAIAQSLNEVKGVSGG